jgi:hypothetical protein
MKQWRYQRRNGGLKKVGRRRKNRELRLNIEREGGGGRAQSQALLIPKKT